MAGGIIGKISDGTNTHLITNTFYATCSTAANTAAKVAKLVDSSINSLTLIQGMLLVVKFTYANTANIPSLKIQTSGGTDLTSSISIKRTSTTSGSAGGVWTDNGISSFIYDGSYWIQTQSYYENDNDKVYQGAVSSANANYEVLLAYTSGTSTLAETNYVNKSENLLFNPNSNILTVGGTVTVGSAPSSDMQVATKKYVDDQIVRAGSGTVTSVTAGTNLQVGDGTGSQSITTTGTLNHAPSGVTAKSIQALYPITFDAQGHITSSSLVGLDPYQILCEVDGIWPIEDSWTGRINCYCVCSTAASTAAKVTSITDGDMPDGAGVDDGTRVIVKFTNGSSVEESTPTLQVNNSNAAPIAYNGAALSYFNLVAGAVVEFVYDGTNWCIVGVSQQDINELWDAILTSDTKVTQEPTSSNANMPVVLSSTTGAAYTGVVYRNDNFTFNPSTGTLTATNLRGALTSSQVTSALGYTPEVNQNAFSNVKVGSSTIAADSKTDTLELVAGTGITLTPDTTNDKITIASSVTGGVSDVQVGGTSIVTSGVANLITNSTYNSSSNKIATMSDLPDEVFVVNVTLTSLTAGTSDKTATEIYNAARAGKFVVAKVPYSAGTTTVAMVAPLSHADIDDGVYSAVFEYHDNEYIGFSYARLVITGSTVALTTSYEGYLFEGGSAEGGVSISATDGLELGSNGGNLSNGQTITVGHSNSVTTQSTQAVYPIAIDAQGHISSYGNAVTIPTVPSAGNTATAVSTTASGGSATTWSKSDHVHSISSSTITSALGYTPPTDDTKVTNTLGTTTKYYVTGTTSSSTNTGTQYFDTGIYSTTTAGQLNATTYKVNEQVTLQWNSTDASLDFIFS